MIVDLIIDFNYPKDKNNININNKKLINLYPLGIDLV